MAFNIDKPSDVGSIQNCNFSISRGRQWAMITFPRRVPHKRSLPGGDDRDESIACALVESQSRQVDHRNKALPPRLIDKF